MKKVFAVVIAVCLIAGAILFVNKSTNRAEKPAALKSSASAKYSAKWVNTSGKYGALILLGKTTIDPKVKEQLKGMPKFKSASPIFGRIVPEKAYENSFKETFFALDASEGSDRGYDTLYLDKNGNGDLRDDGVSVNTSKNPAVQLQFVDIDLIEVKDAQSNTLSPNKYALDVGFYLHAREVQVGLAMMKGYWEGVISTERGDITFEVVDNNLNGKFNDTICIDDKENMRPDFVVLDLSKIYGRSEHVRCVPGITVVDGKLYVLAPSPSGDTLEFYPYEGPTGEVKIEPGRIGNCEIAGSESVYIAGEPGIFDFKDYRSTFTLPAGKYNFVRTFVLPVDRQQKNGSIIYQRKKDFVLKKGRSEKIAIKGNVTLKIAPDSEQLVLERGKPLTIETRFYISPDGEVGLYGKDLSLKLKLLDSSGAEIRAYDSKFG